MPLWMNPPVNAKNCFIAVYRCFAAVGKKTAINYRASADEFCRIYLDGTPVVVGPERGAVGHWYAIDDVLELTPGEHCLCAEVFCFGPKLTAYGQQSAAHGFFWRDAEHLFRDWEGKIVEGIDYSEPFPDWGAYPRVHVTETFDPSVFFGGGTGWEKVSLREDSRILHARDLPRMRHEEIVAWEKNGNLVTFEHYVCAYVEYRFRGRGTVRVRWSETPYESPEFDPLLLVGKKGVRKGSCFIGNHDVFEVNGELFWRDFHFRSGRYLEIETTGTAEIAGMQFFETGYPYQFKKLGDLGSSENNLLAGMALRTLQRCSWETFMDCPFYEQLMYIGDSRIAALLTYCVSDDRCLVEKALRFFAMSQKPAGMICSQFPAKEDQFIPAFALTYVLMVRDYAEHGGRAELIRELLPVTRKILDSFPPDDGWFFLDWVDGWKNGVPKGDCAMQWLFCQALEAQSFLETRFGLEEMGRKYDSNARNLAAKLCQDYWSASCGLFGDAPGDAEFSEHAQAAALLCDHLPGSTAVVILESLRKRPPRFRCGTYFSFYYLSAMRKHHAGDLFDRKMRLWHQFAKEGLDTLPENFGTTRSDCHVWTGHILYFLLQKEKV